MDVRFRRYCAPSHLKGLRFELEQARKELIEIKTFVTGQQTQADRPVGSASAQQVKMEVKKDSRPMLSRKDLEAICKPLGLPRYMGFREALEKMNLTILDQELNDKTMYEISAAIVSDPGGKYERIRIGIFRIGKIPERGFVEKEGRQFFSHEVVLGSYVDGGWHENNYNYEINLRWNDKDSRSGYKEASYRGTWDVNLLDEFDRVIKGNARVMMKIEEARQAIYTKK